MKIIFPLFTLILLSLPVFGLEDDAAKAAAALKILDAYHAENPEPGDRTLRVVCWRTKDRDFAPDYKERLTRIMEHIQNFYADQMERNGFGRRTVQLNYGEDKLLKIHEAIGSENFAAYKKADGGKVAQDCKIALKKEGIDFDRETVVIFTNLVDWDAEKLTFVHKSPYYARGNNKGGVAWQLDSAELDIPNLALKEPIISDGEYGKISLGKHNSIFIGGIAHEMGHGLGLPHCREIPENRKKLGNALMGSGNRSYSDELRGEGKGSFITLAHALRLASHPQFSGSVKGMNFPSRATFSDLSVAEKDQHFTVEGKVSSAIPIYAVIAYLDPSGGGDYDSTTVTAVPDSEGNFLLDCEPLNFKNPQSDIRILALMANGTTSTWRSIFKMKDGKLNMPLMKATTSLDKFIKPLKAENFEEAKKAAAELPEGILHDIAQVILNGTDPNRTTTAIPEIPKEKTSMPLSQVTPKEEKVGFGKPHYDFFTKESPLLIARDELYTNGIYAHAPARHVYELPENSGWKKLTGTCGLPDHSRGTVSFTIRADGEEVFFTPAMRAGHLKTFDIDLSGVKTLELLTTDGGDGIHGDWGYWLNTTLQK